MWRCHRSCCSWNVDWTRMQARAAAARDSANCNHRGADPHPSSSDDRTALHVWGTNEEGHALLTARSWSSTLLAAQRSSCHVAAGETGNQRMIRAVERFMVRCLAIGGRDASFRNSNAYSNSNIDRDQFLTTPATLHTRGILGIARTRGSCAL